MTHQVRNSYRHHRKATWGLVTVLVVAIAAVVIPLANAAEKTYTLTVNPTTLCANASGGASTVVTLRNTGSPQTAGSAEVYFPAGSVQSVSGGGGSCARVDEFILERGEGHRLAQQPEHGPGQTRNVTVTFKSSANFSTAVTAVLKQSNQFNDSSGTANLFTVQGAFPTLRVVQCVTVSGRVYQDRNLDNTYTTGTGAFAEQRRPQGVDRQALREGRRRCRAYPCAVRPRRRWPTSRIRASTRSPRFRPARLQDLRPRGRYGRVDRSGASQSPTGNSECGPISSGAPATSGRPTCLPSLSRGCAEPGLPGRPGRRTIRPG